MTTYLDNAASTQPLPEVTEAVARAMRELWANPSSLHGLGAAAARALYDARTQVAALLHAEADALVFAGSGTEANALGFSGAAHAARSRHAVISSIEHAAVLGCAQRLRAEGWQVSEVAPDRDGRVSTAALVDAVRDETAVVSIMLVNNEIGTLQPVTEIAHAMHQLGRKIHFHVDAVQFAGLVPIDVRTLGADSLAISGHKLHGPKGIGALWLNKGTHIAPLYGGGGQERGLRSGTENLPACVGFGVAATHARQDAQASARIRALRDRLEDLLFAAVPKACPAVPLTTPRAPHIASVLLPGLPAEPVLHALEARGVFASEGAACSSRTREQSRVLRALGVRADTGAIRFSLSSLTTSTEIEQAAQSFAESVAEILDVVGPRQ